MVPFSLKSTVSVFIPHLKVRTIGLRMVQFFIPKGQEKANHGELDPQQKDFLDFQSPAEK
jgi:hypothetical protein